MQLGSEDGLSEYGDSEEPGVSIWQELQDETIRLESRKSSSSSQVSVQCSLIVVGMTNESLYFTDCNNLKASTDSLDSAEDFKPVEINLGEIREVKLYSVLYLIRNNMIYFTSDVVHVHQQTEGVQHIADWNQAVKEWVQV